MKLLQVWEEYCHANHLGIYFWSFVQNSINTKNYTTASNTHERNTKTFYPKYYTHDRKEFEYRVTGPRVAHIQFSELVFFQSFFCPNLSVLPKLFQLHSEIQIFCTRNSYMFKQRPLTVCYFHTLQSYFAFSEIIHLYPFQTPYPEGCLFFHAIDFQLKTTQFQLRINTMVSSEQARPFIFILREMRLRRAIQTTSALKMPSTTGATYNDNYEQQVFCMGL